MITTVLLSDAVLKGGPGSGPHPSESARTSVEHKTAAEFHNQAAKTAKSSEAREAHEDAANMHSAAASYQPGREKSMAGHSARALSVEANKLK